MTDALARGCYQVLSLFQPYLHGEAAELFNELAEDYLQKIKQG